MIAEWIVDGQPWVDVASMDIRRFGRHHRSLRYARVRALDAYSRYYDIVYPHEEFAAGRPLRMSPAYARLRALDAAFGEKSGWERANWFETNAPEGDEALRPHGWAGRYWSPAIGAECLAARDSRRAVRPVVVRQARRPRRGRCRRPLAAVRQRDRPPGGHRGLHPAAQPARRDRGRPDRDPRRRGPLPRRHRDRVRRPRSRLDPPAPARRRLGHRRGRHCGARAATASGARRRARSCSR